MKEEKTVDINNARKAEQIRVMRQIIADGKDPFAWENLPLYHSNEILKKGKFWLVTENQWSYDNARVQLLFIYKENVSSPGEVSDEAFNELFAFFRLFTEKYQIIGGALCMRFGSTQYSGASVNHLHAQIISPQEGTQCTYWIGSQKTEN